MSAQVTRICCYTPGGWTKILAWTHIILCAVGCVLGTLILLYVTKRLETGVAEERKTQVISTLAYMTLGFLLGFVHLYATTKKRIISLWIWFFATLIGLISFTSALIFHLTGTEPLLYKKQVTACGVFKCFMDLFTLAVVYLRIKEIKATTSTDHFASP